MQFQLACAQFAPRKAETNLNLDRIAEIALQAQTQGADLLLLPEACTSGYFLEGGVIEASLTKEQLVEELWRRLDGKMLKSLDLALGFYENEDGNLYNSATYIELRPDGANLLGIYRKFFLPTYGVFDEERFVTRGRELCLLNTQFGRLALLVCEDVWHSVMPTLCAINGAQLLLVPAASPGRGFSGAEIENHDRYRRLFRAVSEEHGLFCANAQLCGFEGGKGFIGGSMIIDPMGNTVAEAPVLDEAMILAEVDTELVTIARAQSPLISDLQSTWEEIKKLVSQTKF